MSKPKKKNALSVAIISLALLLAIAITFTIWNIYSLPQNDYSRRWQFDMPKQLKSVEHVDTTDFSGKGIRFTCFSTKSADKPNNFNADKNVQIEENFETLLTELKLELEHNGNVSDISVYQVDWDVFYYWYANGDGIVVFFYTKRQLLVFEKIGEK
jgi:hypothetical protein